MTDVLPNRRSTEKNFVNDKHKVRKHHKIWFNKKWTHISLLIDRFLCLLYCAKKKKHNPLLANPRAILVLESHLIGDVIMGLPVYRAIKNKFSDAKLIFWGNKWGGELLSDQELFDEFFITHIPWSTYDYSILNFRRLLCQIRQLRQMNIDLAIDFRGDIRNIFLLYLIKACRRVSYDFTGGSYWLTDVVEPCENVHLIERNLNVARYIGIEINDDVPMLDVPDEKIQAAREYFNRRGLDKIVFLHAGASQPKRLWPSERFAFVADYLKNKGYSVVLLCGPNDKTVVESIRGKCQSSPDVLSVPLKEMASYLVCGKFFIGLDSGIGHIAAAIGQDIIILFGPQLPSIACPRGSGKIVIIMKGDFDCRPCHGRLCDFNNACMRAIELADVIKAVEEIEQVRTSSK